jgi:hypothetical protein
MEPKVKAGISNKLQKHVVKWFLGNRFLMSGISLASLVAHEFMENSSEAQRKT